MCRTHGDTLEESKDIVGTLSQFSAYKIRREGNLGGIKYEQRGNLEGIKLEYCRNILGISTVTFEADGMIPFIFHILCV